MKFQFLQDGKLTAGVVTDKGVLPLETPLAQVIAGEAVLPDLETVDGWISDEGITYGPAVPTGGKIVCVGLNYRKHAEEAGMAVPETPVLFNKFDTALAGHDEEIVLPPGAEQCDYEAELGVVIGRIARRVSSDEALDFVFGYTVANDVSARDLQMRTSQWMVGKSLDGFCPVGPYLVTADEIVDPNTLDIELTLNGDTRQRSNTRDMIFPVRDIVSYISQYITLRPGDLILTGTPEGVIAGLPSAERRWLKPGDRITAAIERIGRLSNTLKGE
jgi:2-keto-4-pentenoate hydratase/2-oxohepta-3-ene-1,7-dioic acid hydratase in catechol pathway